MEEHARKRIMDPIHGFVRVSKTATAFLDSKFLQRLRHCKQLGNVHHVYPSAEHSRFSHSLGTAHLGKRVLRFLVETKTGPGVYGRELTATLPFDRFQDNIDMVELAGLCHDVGHGPFSHAFESCVMKPLLKGTGELWEHEEMSCKLVEAVNDGLGNAAVEKEMVQRVQDLIRGTKLNAEQPSGASWSPDQRWLLQIIANGENGIDVDKFDYLQRDQYWTGARAGFDMELVIDSMRVFPDHGICFRAAADADVLAVYTARATMHKKVYQHRKVKCFDMMVADALLEAAADLQLLERATNPQLFANLTDHVVHEIKRWPEHDVSPGMRKAQKLIARMENNRSLKKYHYCCSVEVPPEQRLPDKPEEAIVQCQRGSRECLLSAEDLRVHDMEIDHTARNCNPLDSVLFWDRDLPPHHRSDMLGTPAKFQMREVRVYLAREMGSHNEREQYLNAVRCAVQCWARTALGVKNIPRPQTIKEAGSTPQAAPDATTPRPSRAPCAQQPATPEKPPPPPRNSTHDAADTL